MKAIMALGPKGGCGKTTTILGLAPLAVGDGLKVLMIDTDPQGSLSQWHRDRTKAKDAPPIPGEFQDVRDAAGRLDALATAARHGGESPDVVFIDTKPTVEENAEAIRQLIGRADLVIMPTQPNKLDVRPIGGMMESVHALGRPGLFLVMRGKPRNRDVEQARAWLAARGDVAGVVIPDSVHVTRAMSVGLGVSETGGTGAEEFRALWQEVRRRTGV